MIRTFIRTTLILTIFFVPILAFRISYLLAGYAWGYLSRYRPIRSLRNAASKTIDYILSLFFIPRVFNAVYGLMMRLMRFGSYFKSTSMIARLVSQLWEMESSIYLDPSTFMRALNRSILSIFTFDNKRLLWTVLSMPARLIFFGFAFPLMLLRSSYSMASRSITFITSLQPLGFLRRLIAEPSTLGSLVFFDPSVIKRKLQRMVFSLLSLSPRRMIWNALTFPSRAIIFAFILPLWFFRNAFSIGAMVFGTITSYSTSVDTTGDNLVIDFMRVPVKEEDRKMMKKMNSKVDLNILKDEFMGLMKKSGDIINKKVIVTKDDVQIVDLKKAEMMGDESVDHRDVKDDHHLSHHKREREEKKSGAKRDLKKTRSEEHDEVLDEKIKSDWMKQMINDEPKQDLPLSKQEEQIKKEQESKLQKHEKEKLQAKQKEEEIVSSYSAQIKLLPPHSRREKEVDEKQDKEEEKREKKEDIQMQAPVLNEEKHEELKEKIKTEWVKQVMMHAEPKQEGEGTKKEEKKDVSEILDKETKNMTPLTEVRKKRPKPSSTKKNKEKKKEKSSSAHQEERAQSPLRQEQLSLKKTGQDPETNIQEKQTERKDEEKPEQSQVKQEKSVEKKQKPIINDNTKLNLMKEVIEEDPPAPMYDVMIHAEAQSMQQKEQTPSEETSKSKQEDDQEGKQDKEEEEPITNEVEERGLSYAEISMKPAPVEQEKKDLEGEKEFDEKQNKEEEKREKREDIQMQAPVLNEEKHEELKEKIKTEWVKQVMLHAEPKQEEEGTKKEEKKEEEKSEQTNIQEKQTERKDKEKPEQSQVKQEKSVEKKQKPIINDNTKLNLMKEVIEEDPPAPMYDVMIHAEAQPLQQKEQTPTEEASKSKQEDDQEGKQDREEEEPITNEVEERGLSYAEIAMKPAPVEQEDQKISSTSSQIKLLPPRSRREKIVDENQEKKEEKQVVEMQAPIVVEEKHKELREKKERQATDKKRNQREKEQGQEDLEKEIEMKQTPKEKSKKGLRRSNRDVNDLIEAEHKQVQETKAAIQAPLIDEEKHEELKEKIKTEWVKQVMLHAEPKQEGQGTKKEEKKEEEKQQKKEDIQMQAPVLNEEKHEELKEKIKTEWVKQVMMHAEPKQEGEEIKKEEKKDVSEILDKETKNMTPLTEVRKKRPKPSSTKKNKDKKKEKSSSAHQEERAQSPLRQEQLSLKKTDPVIQSIPELKISELEEEKPEQSQVKQEKPVEKKTLLDENTKLDLMKEVIEEDPPAPMYDVMIHAETQPVQQKEQTSSEEPSKPKQDKEMIPKKQEGELQSKQKEEPIKNQVEERGLSYEQIAMKPPSSSTEETGQQKDDDNQHQSDKSTTDVDNQLEERRLHHEIHKIDIVEKISKEDHVMKPKRAHSIHSPSTRRTF